jgi:hypothetical protein
MGNAKGREGRGNSRKKAQKAQKKKRRTNRGWSRLRKVFLRRPAEPDYGGQDGAAGYGFAGAKYL